MSVLNIHEDFFEDVEKMREEETFDYHEMIDNYVSTMWNSEHIALITHYGWDKAVNGYQSEYGNLEGTFVLAKLSYYILSEMYHSVY
jgi:hypothetical protein